MSKSVLPILGSDQEETEENTAFANGVSYAKGLVHTRPPRTRMCTACLRGLCAQ